MPILAPNQLCNTVRETQNCDANQLPRVDLSSSTTAHNVKFTLSKHIKAKTLNNYKTIQTEWTSEDGQ